MGIETGIAIGIGVGTFAMGIGTTIVGIKAGLVSKSNCKSCNTQLTGSIMDLKEDIEKLSGKHDETNNALREIMGYMKGKGDKL